MNDLLAMAPGLINSKTDTLTAVVNSQTGLTQNSDVTGTEGPNSNANALLPLQVKALGYAIKDKPLLQAINLEISSSDITAILGHNGAGKSIFLRLLHGLIPPTTGTIKWHNHRVAELYVRKKQAMVFQKPVVLRRSVAANIDYVLALRHAASEDTRQALLRDANLLSKSKQAATSLSGGEQQRLAIARALATDPSVLFLDEPTASMDPTATAAIEEQLHSVSRRGIKIIIVTHDTAQARRLADDIVFLHQGTVTEHTIATDFFPQPGSAAAQQYVDRQL